MDAEQNFEMIHKILIKEAKYHNLKEVFGVAPFSSIYKVLMPVQQAKLRELSGNGFDNLINNGSIISIAYSYPEYAITSIAIGSEGNYDKEKWNIYAREYNRLNDALNETSLKIASEIGGISIPATTERIAAKIKHVKDFYPLVVSHRVAAEQSGVGWRGKNELIVNPKFSCAIRLASVLTTLPINRTSPTNMSCGGCRACLNTCTYLRYKDKFQDYREQCRSYLISLDLISDVCGKCIKSCYIDSIYRGRFKL